MKSTNSTVVVFNQEKLRSHRCDEIVKGLSDNNSTYIYCTNWGLPKQECLTAIDKGLEYPAR
ncbi:hypothetical protein DFP96_105158 [Listeria rocourtiae]|uniref:Uncharacterized protein n=1 Tax=Listeria rocourtiae TaxID=647910 RepID=A0A4R6ZLS5_9LIST|nr:hypothetical protein DFP96_105158 [Listeria rocourtiae]